MILFTAKVQPLDPGQWADLPVVGGLGKPFDLRQLAATVKSLLGWP